MYQYRNLPPRHQPPGFYPPHQPSLKNQFREPPNHESLLQQHPVSHSLSPPNHAPHPTIIGAHTANSPPAHYISPPQQHHEIPPRQQQINGQQPLQRSHSHGLIPRPTSHTFQTHEVSQQQQQQTEVIKEQETNGPDALHAIQHIQRIKAAAACQIINNRVVEAIRLQQQKKIQQKKLKKKYNPNWKDPNETNPNNPAYKGPENAKLVKMLSKKQKAAKKKQQKQGGNSNNNGNNSMSSHSNSNDNDSSNDQISVKQTEESQQQQQQTQQQPPQQPSTLGVSSQSSTASGIHNYYNRASLQIDEENMTIDQVIDQQYAFAELEQLERSYKQAMRVPQLEICGNPHSTHNITNITDEELKMNPELYKMYSYYVPFANSTVHPQEVLDSINKNYSPKRNNHHNKTNGKNNNMINNNNNNKRNKSSHLRSQSLPPRFLEQANNNHTNNNHHHSPPHNHHNNNNHHNPHYSFRTNMGPRRMNPNFLKPQLNRDRENNNNNNSNNDNQSPQQSSQSTPRSPQSIKSPQSKTRLVPIGKERPNPLETNPPNPIISKSAYKQKSKSAKNNPSKSKSKKKDYKKGEKEGDKPSKDSPYIAPAHANVQSVISPNGGIYHPCHGYSTRDISIFDLFPAIVKYQSKKYAESDRVDYLLSLSDKPFSGINNRPLKSVDIAEMWYIALKYLFNDITLGQFDYMTMEMRYVIKQYMASHQTRLSFLNAIKQFGFLRTISDVSKKLPREHIQKLLKHQQHQKDKEIMQMAVEQKLKEQEHAKRMLYLQQQQHLLLTQHGLHSPPVAYPHGPTGFGHLPGPHTHISPHAHPHAHPRHPYHTLSPQHPHPTHIGTPLNVNGHLIQPQVKPQMQQHYNDWYNGNRLKRTISEPTPLLNTNRATLPSNGPGTPQTDVSVKEKKNMPAIIDDDDDFNDIDDFITEIVNENKIESLPDLPPDASGNGKSSSSSKSPNKKLLTPQSKKKSGIPANVTKELLFGDATQILSPNVIDNEASISNDDEREDMESDMSDNEGCNDGDAHINKKDVIDTECDDEKGDENEVVDVYAMMYQTMKDQNDNSRKEIMENQEQSKSNTLTLNTLNDINNDEQDRESPIIKMDDKSSSNDNNHDDDSKHEKSDNHGIDVEINVDIDDESGPNISFAELSGYSNKPKTDENFIPKLPFNVNWRNSNLSSIWVDNPYAKPSKSFKSKSNKYKKHKHKRGKSQRK